MLLREDLTGLRLALREARTGVLFLTFLDAVGGLWLGLLREIDLTGLLLMLL